MNLIYTTGYLGKRLTGGGSKPQGFRAFVHYHGATVFDIRHRPWSRAACWRKAALEQLLGDDYRHVPALGNRNYNRDGAPIEIVDLAAGIREILAHPRPVLLLCACEEDARCHRRVVGNALLALGCCVTTFRLWDIPITPLETEGAVR